MRILVTDGEKHSLGMVRSLGKLGIDVSVIASKESSLPFYSKYCKHFLVCPELDDERKYIDFLEKILKTCIYDMIIPVGYRTNQIISKNREQLSRWVRLEVVHSEKMEIALNKKKTYQVAQNIGIPYPETVYPESFQDLIDLSTTIRYPIVIKGLQEAGRNIVAYARNRDELLQNFSRLCEENNLTGENLPMLQEYIQGRGYGFFALYQHGTCKKIFMHRRIREYPVSGGASACAQSFYDSRLKDYGIRLLDALEWHGVAMVEFKGNEQTGDYKMLELNPKFWGSLDLAIAAGVDFPHYLHQMALGEDLVYSEEYYKNLRFHWPFNGDIQHVIKNIRSILPFLYDLFNPDTRNNVELADIKPNLRELYLLLVALVPKRLINVYSRF